MDTAHDAIARLLALFGELGVIRPRDLTERGLPVPLLRRLTDEGRVVRLGRGLYGLSDDEPDEHRLLLTACRRVPGGVLCLLSALSLHGLTTQQPHRAWLALSRSARQPAVDHPPLAVVRMSGPSWTTGREEQHIEGVAVPVFGVAKTVADCFKFRSRVGLDVALEALQQTLAERRASVDELWAMARVCRVTRIIQPYLEALAWQADANHKITEGVAQAQAGQLADGDEAFERLARRIDAHQPSARGR